MSAAKTGSPGVTEGRSRPLKSNRGGGRGESEGSGSGRVAVEGAPSKGLETRILPVGRSWLPPLLSATSTALSELLCVFSVIDSGVDGGQEGTYKMASEFGTGKTIFVLAIVVGCFAVLWPKVFYPMLTASTVKPPAPGKPGKLGRRCRASLMNKLGTADDATSQ